ncbi:putative transmembrane protein [Toxoplasma gondii TgCatPRC2]|uniref:Transmembrane protein n=4 Tax=Toxoplasma gondii TaxID=5811 RepID=S8G8A4_TOXGM|nr:hypothetical protein TGME49_289610 [Toxoplasma gondii ME49]EPT27955.1 hypothetical protein TGME49_289610 [Toxoplasma gondii ME49]KYF45129.1 hypothetical protein TGARI_289610 [Toxoplasma gondii ARI]KYK69566.1 putative transmembrane protein [Toxoplasma gondii TgCatPRC2]PIM01650.1 putative transmembrane protein [Toxoplasma gondii COUG]|eukprot:XP_002368386.1 hypothetical protein TGME49_289610 [Toxoplasma gondii ME49]
MSMMATGPSQVIRFIVNRTGNLPTIKDAQIDPTWTVDRIIQECFASELAAGEHVRLIYMGHVLQGSATLSFNLAGNFPSAGSSRSNDAAAATPSSGLCTVHAHIRSDSRCPAASFNHGDGGVAHGDDWSTVVLRVACFIVLGVCWYHRTICPRDYTLVSTAILCVFTAVYVLSVQSVFDTPLRALLRMLRFPRLRP